MNRSWTPGLDFLSTCCLGLAWLVAGGIGLSLAASPSDVPQAVGYVEQLIGDMASLSLERAQKPLSLALLLPVRSGDRLLVQGPGNKVLLRCGNRRVTVTERESPFVIPRSESPPGFLMRLGTLLVDLGSRLTAQQVKTVTRTSTSSRGEDEPLTLLFFEGGTSQLANDLTALSVAWRGGEPPYTVELASADHRVLIEKEGVHSQRVRLPLPGGTLRERFLRLRIQDSTGQEVEAVFDFVPANLVPTTDRSVKQVQVPANLRVLLQADLLMKLDPGRWSYQAYQSVEPLADSFMPARWFRDCLEDGSWCYQP